MITVYDKLKLFNKRILELKQNEYNIVSKKLEEKRKEEVIDRKSLSEIEAKKYKKYLLKDIKLEYKQRLSNARSEKKRRILIKKKDMIDILLLGVKKYAEGFVESSKYEEYLIRILKESKNQLNQIDEIIIFMTDKDTKSYKNLIKKELDIDKATFVVTDKIIGGLLIEFDNQRIDMSLDAVIYDNEEYMGRLINKLLESQVDNG